MIFVDSNIPMYLVGAEHPNKHRSKELLERLLLRGEELVTDAEAFQEILHRYVAIRRPEAIGPAFELLEKLVSQIYPVEMRDVHSAREYLENIPHLTARDAIHLGIMKRRGIDQILSFDSHFDNLPGIVRSY